MENNPYGLVALWNQGGWIIQCVALLLLIMSVVSWTIIVLKTWQAYKLYGVAILTAAFWRTSTFDEGLHVLKTARQDNPFYTLAREGLLSVKQHTEGSENLRVRMGLADWLRESLRGSIDESAAKMQSGLSILASIGATAPFIGLFGTVWGIYHALVNIGISGQASIDKVAGPVGESLIMTAFGLVVAIPAVLGYNALLRINRRLLGQLNRFARQLYAYFLTGTPMNAGVDPDKGV